MLNFLWSTVSSVFIPGILLAIIFVIVLIGVVQTKKILYPLYFLMVWFPIESLLLNFVSVELYSILKYVPEVILYSLLLILYVKNKQQHRGGIIPHRLQWPFVAFVVVALLSLVLNWYDPTVWILGVRQMIRFVSVFFIIILAHANEKERKNLVRLAFVMIFLEVIFGLIQFGFRGHLDRWLFSTREIMVGSVAILGSNDFFWTPGTRIFATMGRYDQLGSFIMLGLVLALPWLYRGSQQQRLQYGFGMVLSCVALILTSSRASWLGVLAGSIMVGYGLFHDKKVWHILGIGVAAVGIYLISFMITHDNIVNITEKNNQALAERILEAGSLRAWRESYEGYGRIFFMVTTPRTVVADSPLFGVGPGNYGGGVAAALHNTSLYDRLHLPFGVQNTYGQIDNSWFSLWGELGTLGLLVVVWIFVVLGREAKHVYVKSHDDHTKALAAGFFGLVVALAVVGFFGPYFEFRTLMFYFWLIAGLVCTSLRHEDKQGNFLGNKV